MNSSKPLVLVVDDDAGGRRLTRATLSKAGFDVVEAGNGELALQSMRNTMPDLVLLDVSMPVMDGFQACEQLRQMPGGDAVPVVMMTGLDDTQSIERAFQVGATDFITKPINWTVLPHRVHYMLRASDAINALQQSQRRLSNAQRIADMGDWEWDLRRDVLEPSPQAWRLLGHEGACTRVSSETFFLQVHEEDRDRVRRACNHAAARGEGFAIDHRVQTADGEVRHVHQQVEVIERNAGGTAQRLAGALHDITGRKDAEEQIKRLAYFDALTGLPNRMMFNETLSRAVAQAQRHQRRLAVMFVDLDNFKRVNDTLGHRAGDELLRTASARLGGALRHHDTVTRQAASEQTAGLPGDSANSSIARLGGDEFIVLLNDVPSAADAASVARRLVNVLRGPITVQGTEVFVGGSVGVAVYPEDGDDTDTLLMNADTAMYRAKAAGRGSFQMYDRSMNDGALDHLRMETHLRRALERDEFVLHYQPRVDVITGEILGAEALIRWQHPERGLLPPSEFIPLVEEAGLVIPIGEWAIRTVCRQNALWQSQGQRPLKVAVNLASTHLRERGLPALVQQALQDHGVSAECLEIEVTESILLTEQELSVSIAQQLADMGVHLSIDDFGTGYSSMSYLKKLPIEALKIDLSFVRDLVTDPDDEAIVCAIIALAHSLKLRVVAEGVETAAQLARLRSMGCDSYQGYFASRPIPADDFRALVALGTMPALLRA